MLTSTMLLVLLQLMAFNTDAAFRFVEIENELKSASFVGEVVFTSYDTLCTFGAFPARYDSILQDSIVFSFVRARMTAICYFDLANQVHKNAELIYNARYRTRNTEMYPPYDLGYWPDLGDTVLLVLDSVGKVSLFASIYNCSYIFWDPYLKTSYFTFFAYNTSVFNDSPIYHQSAFLDRVSNDLIEFSGYKRISVYYCIIHRCDLIKFGIHSLFIV